MKQKIWVNILIVIIVSGFLLVLWFNGLDWLYAQFLRAGANLLLIVSEHTKVGVEMVKGAPTFIVETLVNGRKGTYPQKADLILLPFIMVLTWQILLFFNLKRRDSVRSAIENTLIFYVIQVIYVLLLTAYYDSKVIKFIYDLLIDSFYIIALFLIIKDAFKYELIGITRKNKG